MTNRPLNVRKYHSSRLKKFDNNIQNTFEESRALGEVIGLADSQILRTIRDVNKRTIDKEKLEILIRMRNHYKHALTYRQHPHGSPYADMIRNKLLHLPAKNKRTALYKRLWDKYLNDQVNSCEYRRLQEKTDRILFQEDYITVVMDQVRHYEVLYKEGFYLNGRHYRRLSCSAGQARVSTVVFCYTGIIDEVKRRLNNGRDLSMKHSPSKFNAYFGLAGSATRIVSEPKFIVVKDYENTTSFMANYVIENAWRADDTVVPKYMEDVKMNRTDGMGLISPRQARKWAAELDLDYVPSQFCVRQNFIKGMLCVFDIHAFCTEKNGGDFLVDTIYKDSAGNYIKADLREYDVIITESQFKLWDSYPNLETYIHGCHQNNLHWGVSLVTPKEAKRMLKLNYQFIQTLNLDSQDIKALARQFTDWVKGVSYDDVYYMLLFLLGPGNSEEKIENFLSGSDNYWLKSLMLNHSLKNDKYIRTKVRDLIRHKIDRACMGDIFVDGNFQVIVSDPYGFMQHVCGQEVTGLLAPGMSYSNYWNERNIGQVDAMRSPLTYLSEHVILQLQEDEETEKWFRHCKLGIILNYHGHETFNFAGSDFDYDILATTSNETMIKGVCRDELPVVYEPPRPEKIHFTEDDLYIADTFSFGSIIGQITNKSSNGYALLPLLEDQYGKNSGEYKLVKSRLQQCCKAQSAQIDKAKLGREVKGIPGVWVNRIKLPQGTRRRRRKELYNAALLNTRPYFFRYLYKDTKQDYRKYLDSCQETCKQLFMMKFAELEALPEKTPEQLEFIQNFYRYCPVIISSSPMNLLCRHIEETDFSITKQTRVTADETLYEQYKNHDVAYQDNYKEVAAAVKTFLKNIQNKKVTGCVTGANGDFRIGSGRLGDFVADSQVNLSSGEGLSMSGNQSTGIAANYTELFDILCVINSNPQIVTNCLVDYFYRDYPRSNKDILWRSYGKYIYRNVRKNTGAETFYFPFPAEDGSIAYMGYRYELKELSVDQAH